MTTKRLYSEGQRLTPLYATGERRNGHIVWMFRCKCGVKKAIRKDYVKSGRAKSCGCFYLRGRHRRAEIQAALPKDDGMCAICHKIATLEIDHDHRCCPQSKMCPKCVRGRLCGECNKALGLFQDNISMLESAIEYLRRFNGIRIE